MKVLLLGATGRTGIHVLETLLQEGHSVNAVVRDKSKIKTRPGTLTIFEGNASDPGTLRPAMQGCEAIISVLNISRTSDFPWAKLRTPTTFLSDSMAAIINTADEFSIKKIIGCSAWGVHETKKDIPGWFRWIINNSNVGIAYKDHERQEELLRHSKFDYTIVRPVGLTNSGKQQAIRETVNNIPRPALIISRKSVAKFIARQLEDNTYTRKAVTISRQ